MHTGCLIPKLQYYNISQLANYEQPDFEIVKINRELNRWLQICVQKGYRYIDIDDIDGIDMDR